MGIRQEGTSPDTGDAKSHSFGDMVRQQAHFLPDQGPISTFIHHNTLHAFEHLDLHRGLSAASKIHGSHGYLSQARNPDHES